MFNKRLEELRKASGLSQGEFGKRMGEKYGNDFKMSQAVVSSYEKGIREPSDFRVYVNIADFFSVTTDYLLGVENKKSTSLLNEVQQLLVSLSEESLQEIIKYVQFLKWKEQY